MKKAVYRFFRYSMIGGGTFLIDLSLLFVWTDFLRINYLLAACFSFILAVSLNYFISRKYVFHGSTRNKKEGYTWFIGIALSGMAIVAGMMYILVSRLAMNYLIARVFVALFTGVWNYLLNLYFNFRVVGQHT